MGSGWCDGFLGSRRTGIEGGRLLRSHTKSDAVRKKFPYLVCDGLLAGRLSGRGWQGFLCRWAGVGNLRSFSVGGGFGAGGLYRVCHRFFLLHDGFEGLHMFSTGGRAGVGGLEQFDHHLFCGSGSRGFLISAFPRRDQPAHFQLVVERSIVDRSGFCLLPFQLHVLEVDIAMAEFNWVSTA